MHILAKMVVNSAQFYEVFHERFPNKKTIPLTKKEEIKSCLQNYSQNSNKKTQAEKVHDHNWFSRYYLQQFGEDVYVLYSSNNRRMVCFGLLI